MKAVGWIHELFLSICFPSNIAYSSVMNYVGHQWIWHDMIQTWRHWCDVDFGMAYCNCSVLCRVWYVTDVDMPPVIGVSMLPRLWTISYRAEYVCSSVFCSENMRKGFVQFMLHGYEYDMFRPQTHKETEQQHPFWRVLMYFEVSMPYPICVRHNTTWTGHQFLEYLCFLGSITLFAFYTNILHWADLYPCTMSYHLQNSEHLEQGMNYSSFPQKNFLGWGLLSNYAHILEIWVLISMLLKPIRHLLAVPYIVTFLQVP